MGSGCRPFIGLDGCHLRSKYLGILFTASALDSNSGFFLVVIAVVEGKSGETWHWFLKCLLTAFQEDFHGISFILDQEKRLHKTITISLPHVEHRVCMRHL